MDKFSDELIKIIKNQTPAGINSVDLLRSVLPMSKEAAYRRLRGEIVFSLEEAVKLSQRFNISLDNLKSINSSTSQQPHVRRLFNPCDQYDSINKYCLLQENYISCVKRIKMGNNPSILCNTHLFPHPYIYKYPNISKLRVYRFFYSQNEDTDHYGKFSEFIVPERILELEQILYRETLPVQLNYICSKDLILAYMTDINYFHKLGILSREDVENQQQSLFSLMDDISYDAMEGKNAQRAIFLLFVSGIRFSANCVYFSCDDFEKLIVQLFGFNIYSFNDQNSIKDMKNWMDNLVKSSILISSCGEKQRIDFFRQQRDIIASLNSYDAINIGEKFVH